MCYRCIYIGVTGVYRCVSYLWCVRASYPPPQVNTGGICTGVYTGVVFSYLCGGGGGGGGDGGYGPASLLLVVNTPFVFCVVLHTTLVLGHLKLGTPSG